MDKQLISKRFSKAIATYPQEANVQRQIADKMIHLLTKHISFPCSKVIEFGCGTGIYSRMLLQALRPEELFLNDLCPEVINVLPVGKGTISASPGRKDTCSFLSISSQQYFISGQRSFRNNSSGRRAWSSIRE